MNTSAAITGLLLLAILVQTAVLPVLPASPSIDLVAAVLVAASATTPLSLLAIPAIVAGVILDALADVTPLGSTAVILLLLLGVLAFINRLIRTTTTSSRSLLFLALAGGLFVIASRALLTVVEPVPTVFPIERILLTAAVTVVVFLLQP